MFEVIGTTIHLTRGDIASLDVCAKVSETEDLIFQPGDIVRFKVCKKKRYDDIVLCKDVEVAEETSVATIVLYSDDTRIGELINKPVDYYYEIERNPDTAPQTIIGHDKNGPKILTLYPEGGDFE